MPDQSHLDEKYFIDENVYNCPFCNRRHVSYSLNGHFAFNWTERKICYGYVVKCSSCGLKSMHLSFFKFVIVTPKYWRFDLDDVKPKQLDEMFFYSVPTSFFVLDNRIPRQLRELLTEAEGCLKSNFLTGGSACARKVIYELAVLQEASEDNYEDRIKSLKAKNPSVPQEFFDTLLTVHQVTSGKVHENSNDAWEATHLRLILAALREVLHEIYVVPALRQDRREQVLALKTQLLGDKSDASSPEALQAADDARDA